MRALEPTLRSWYVRDTEGDGHNVEAHFCFDNSDDGRGLVFRRYIHDNPNNKTEVVLAFANGHWRFYKEIERDLT